MSAPPVLVLLIAANAAAVLALAAGTWLLHKEIRKMNPAIQKIVDDAAQIKTVAQSAQAVITGIPQLIKDAVAKAIADNGLSPEDLAAVTQVATDLEQTAADLSGAITANTPAAPAAPADPNAPVQG